MRLPTFLFLALAGVPPQSVGVPLDAPHRPGLWDVSLRVLRAVESGDAGALQRAWGEDVAVEPAPDSALFGMAELARLEYRYDEAEALYRRLARSTPADGAARLYANLGLAQAHASRGNLLTADSLFSEAWSAARSRNDSVASALAGLGLAATSARLRGGAEARRYLAESRALVPADVPYLDALIICGLASGLGPTEEGVFQREVAKGVARSQEAHILRARASCRTVEARRLVNAGKVREAIVVLTTAKDDQEAGHDRVGLAATLQWSAYLARTVGSYAATERLALEAITEGEASGNLSPVAWSYLELANLRRLMGDVPKGLEEARRAETLLRSQGDQWGLAALLDIMGNLEAASGDFEGATATFLEARKAYRTFGNTNSEFSILVSLSGVLAAANDVVGSRRYLAEANAMASANGMSGWIAGLEFNAAELDLRAGDLGGAREHLDRYLQNRMTGVRLYKAQARLAEIQARSGDAQGAAETLHEALGALDRYRAALTTESLKRYAYQVQETWSDADLGVATVLAVLVRDGLTEEAFSLAERQRARLLLEGMLRTDANPVVQPSQASTAAEIIRVLPRNTAILQYVVGQGGEPTTLFSLGPGGLRGYVLTPVDSLAPDIERFATLVRSGTLAEPLGRRLVEALLAPALADLPATVTRLVVVPDGPLHRLPLDALPLSGGSLLLDAYVTVTVPSSSVAAQLWTSRAPVPETVGILALGDPVFPSEADARSTEVGALYRAAFQESGGLPVLNSARQEVRRAGRFSAHGVVLTGSEASEHNLKNADLSAVRILHLATHALVDTRSTTRTAVALAAGFGEDGFVGVDELGALDLEADLVILSACRTAEGVLIRGEGLTGLTDPLLRDGVGAVVGTGWSIRDDVAADVIAGLYDGLAEGLDVATALQNAKRDARDRGVPPSEWAAFTVVGDGTRTLPLQKPGLPWTPLLAALAAVGAIGAGALTHRRRRNALAA